MDFMWLEARHLKTGEKTLLAVGESFSLVGRPDADMPAEKLTVTFDSTLSPSHFWIRLTELGVQVRRCPGARRPLFFQGRAQEFFEITPGQSFSSGHSFFRILEDDTPATRPAELDLTVLSILQEHNASRDLRALLALQPLLKTFSSTPSLFRGTLALLGEILPSAEEFILIEMFVDAPPRIIARKGNSHYPPSQTLMRQSIQRNSTLYCTWKASEDNMNCWGLAAPIKVADKSYVLYTVGTEKGAKETPGYAPGILDRAVISFVGDILAGALAQRALTPAPSRPPRDQ